MSSQKYLLDTHALFFWVTATVMSDTFRNRLDEKEQAGELFISSISFWEFAFLCKKGKIQITNLKKWRNEILENSGLILLSPTIDDMIDSVGLPNHHRDPFDRLLIAQAKNMGADLVSRDGMIKKYPVKVIWMDG